MLSALQRCLCCIAAVAASRGHVAVLSRPAVTTVLCFWCQQAELQRQLEVRGLDKDGDKDELATRLLDNLIAQVSYCDLVMSCAGNTTAVALQPNQQGLTRCSDGVGC